MPARNLIRMNIAEAVEEKGKEEETYNNGGEELQSPVQIKFIGSDEESVFS